MAHQIMSIGVIAKISLGVLIVVTMLLMGTKGGMRRDALITTILIETICIGSLIYYLIARALAWEPFLEGRDAMAALFVAIIAPCAYALFVFTDKSMRRFKK